MSMNHTVKFLVTDEQFDTIKENAEERGFSTISHYLRHLALDVDLRFIKMLIEIHDKVMNNETGN